MKSRIAFIFILCISVLANIVLLVTLSSGYLDLQDIQELVLPNEKNCKYQYINPLRCEPDQTKNKGDYTQLRNDLLGYIEAQKTLGTITDAGVYLRDLQNGPIMSINSQTNFIPASLLKLPLMMTFYKKAESDPDLLQRRVTIPADIESLDQDIVPEKSAMKGSEYTIDELITLMVSQSDNISWKMLLDYLRIKYSENDFVTTLSDLGVVDPRIQNDQQYITVQGYSSILRILYNSSYLSPEKSNKALQALSKSTYHNGLEKGLPEGLTVSHKFGEQKNGDQQQLHDCGIIYYPATPYILCVMTVGHTIVDLEPVIQHISQVVYHEIEKR